MWTDDVWNTKHAHYTRSTTCFETKPFSSHSKEILANWFSSVSPVKTMTSLMWPRPLVTHLIRIIDHLSHLILELLQCWLRNDTSIACMKGTYGMPFSNMKPCSKKRNCLACAKLICLIMHAIQLIQELYRFHWFHFNLTKPFAVRLYPWYVARSSFGLKGCWLYHFTVTIPTCRHVN